MVEASQRYEVALKNPDCLIHMQPMQINLLQHKAVLSYGPPLQDINTWQAATVKTEGQSAQR